MTVTTIWNRGIRIWLRRDWVRIVLENVGLLAFRIRGLLIPLPVGARIRSGVLEIRETLHPCEGMSAEMLVYIGG